MENIEPPGSTYNPNFRDAETFLRVLGADATSTLHWQLVPERANSSARPLSFVGSFAEVGAKLAAANAAGAAVFVGVTVMAENAPARQAEYDCGSPVMVLDLDGAALPTFNNGFPRPHLICESSPGRFHCLWKLSERLPPAAWQAQQRRLAARFGGDRSVGNPAQTLRVPGFLHQKNIPFRSRIIERRDGPTIDPEVFIAAIDVADAAAVRFTSQAGRRGDAGVIVRGADGKVIDGRETWLRDLVFEAWRDDPGATPEAIAAAAIARFRETTSLHASRRYRNWDEIERAALTKARAVVKKERRRERAAAAEPWTPPPELEPAAAQEQMRALIREHIETHAPRRIDPETERVPYDPEKPKPRTAIVATAGLGKSTTFIEVLAEMVDDFGAASPRCIWYVTATYALARELAGKARAAGLRASAIRGRTYTSGEDDPPLCARADVVKAITAAGVTNVRGNLCEKDKDPEDGTGGESVKVKCIYFDNCAYWAQFDDAHIYFLSHEYLFLTPTDKLPRPDYVVIDELPLNAFFVERHCAPEAVTGTAHDAGPIVQAAIEDMRRGVDPREGLRRGEITASALRETAAAIRKLPEHDAGAAVWPHLADEVILRQLKRRAVPWAARFLDAIATEFQFRRDRLAGVRYRRRVAYDDANTVECLEFQQPSTIKVKHSVPMLLLDGTANKILVQEFFADHDAHQGDDEMTPEELAWRRGVGFVEIHARRSARVTQITNFSAAKRRLLSPVGRGRPETYADKYLPVIFDRLPKDEPILFVTYKVVEEYITESERLRALVPANVELAHFGGIRGRDCWKHVAGVVVLGRNLPPAEDAERIALGLRGHVDVPLPPTGGEYEHAAVRWRAKDGRGGVTRDWRHPDPLIEAIRWSICDAETMQAADRARLVWPDGPKWVVLFNSTPTLAADELIPLERWLGLAADPLARFGELLVRDGGVVVLSGKRLAKLHPDLFQTPEAARVAVHRVTKNPPAEVPTGIAGVSVPVGIMRGKGPPDRPGPETPVLTTLPGQPTAVAVSRQVEACVWVKDSAGRRHHVIRAEAGHFDLGAGAAHFVVPDMPTKAED